VRDGEIELNAEGRPGTTIADERLLDGRVGIEHRLAVDLVDAGVDVAAEIGQHGAFEEFVFEINGAPVMHRLGIPHAFAGCVGVAEVFGEEEVEGRVGVGCAFVGCRQAQSALQTRTWARSWARTWAGENDATKRRSRASDTNERIGFTCLLSSFPSFVSPAFVRRRSASWRGVLMSAASRPQLFNKGIRHAGDVVGYGAGQAFGGDLRLVVGGEQAGVGHQEAEESCTTCSACSWSSSIPGEL